MSYRLLARGVLRLADGLTITRDMQEWGEYRAWLKAGNTPAPEEIIIPPRWPSLDAGKLEVWARCKLRRDALESSGFTYLGKTIDSDHTSVQRISVAVQAAQMAAQASVPFAIQWTCADSSTLLLDAQAMLGMPVAMVTRANALHVKARTFKDRIKAAADVAELEGIEGEIEGEWAT